MPDRQATPSSDAGTRPHLVLAAVLRVMQPLARLLVRHGVGYPAFAAALKRVFLDAASAELAARGMARTDSALTLLSGVHRRDVRTLTRGAGAAARPADAAATPLSLAAEVVARWLGRADPGGPPPPLARAGFDALVAEVSSDVRPRAVLDELLRLGVARQSDDGIALVASGFAPRGGFAETATLFADNLRDHALAAAANLQGDANFLEQAVFVDRIGADSAAQLQRAAVEAWRRAFAHVMHEAQQRFDADAARPAPERRHRARFGVYFYSEAEDPE